MTRTLLWTLAVLVVVAAAIATNFALLGYSQERDEPVGKLSPLGAVVAPSARPRPSITGAQPSGGASHPSGDDHRGRGADD